MTSIYVVVRAEHYGGNYPVRAFETEEEAESWVDEESEKYEQGGDEFGGEWLEYENGRFNFLVETVPWESGDLQ